MRHICPPLLPLWQRSSPKTRLGYGRSPNRQTAPAQRTPPDLRLPRAQSFPPASCADPGRQTTSDLARGLAGRHGCDRCCAHLLGGEPAAGCRAGASLLRPREPRFWSSHWSSQTGSPTTRSRTVIASAILTPTRDRRGRKWRSRRTGRRKPPAARCIRCPRARTNV